MASEGCSVGGDRKLLIEKLNEVETAKLNKLAAVTVA